MFVITSYGAKTFMFDSKGHGISKVNTWDLLRSNFSLALFLSNQQKYFVDRRKWIHEE